MTVSGGQQRDSAKHTHVFILPQTPLPCMLPHDTEQRFLGYTVGPCWLSTSNIAVGTRQSQTPQLSHPSPFLLGNHWFKTYTLLYVSYINKDGEGNVSKLGFPYFSSQVLLNKIQKGLA